MTGKVFPPEIKPREIFVYVCERIAQTLLPYGFTYRKSRNEIARINDDIGCIFHFQPSIKSSSVRFRVYIEVFSKKHRQLEKERGKNAPAGNLFFETLAYVAGRADETPLYNIATLTERERVISEISQLIQEKALPFFDRFNDLVALQESLRENGTLFPGRKKNREETQALVKKLDECLHP